jgi:hypothetical protein
MAVAVVMVGVGGVSVKGMTVVAVRWAVPLASAPSRLDRLARVCGGTVDTVNIGSRAPACPPFNIALCERGSLPQERQAPPIRVRDGGPSIWGDHLPYIEVSHDVRDSSSHLLFDSRDENERWSHLFSCLVRGMIDVITSSQVTK